MTRLANISTHMLLAIVVGFALGTIVLDAIAHDVPEGAGPKARVAHFYIESYTEDRWDAMSHDRCGNGATWLCDWRKRASCAERVGSHSRRCFDHHREVSIFGSGRTCEVRGRSEHGRPVASTVRETCW